MYYQEELENPEINNNGFYRGYTVEIDVSMIAINTILQSEFLKEFEDLSPPTSGLKSRASLATTSSRDLTKQPSLVSLTQTWMSL